MFFNNHVASGSRKSGAYILRHHLLTNMGNVVLLLVKLEQLRTTLNGVP